MAIFGIKIIKVMSYELIGKLIFKGESMQKTESFKLREFAVEKSEDSNGKTFVSYVKFQCVQDKVSILDNVSMGDEIKVYFNIKGNKSERDGKTSYFTNLDAWRIEQMLGTQSAAASNSGFVEPLDTFTADASDAMDDLPF